MRILNFGSLNLDRTYEVPHFVRPGETLRAHRFTENCGGKGLNQSIAFARAGAEVWHAGRLGADGVMLSQALRQAGVNTTFVETEPGVATGHAVIQVEEAGQNCILLYEGANGTVDEAFVHRVLCHFSEGDYLVLQNEISGMECLLREAPALGLHIVLNPSPMTEALKNYDLDKVEWFILNEIEGAELAGVQAPEAICDTLLQRFPRARLVLTLGEKGAMYADGAQRAACAAVPVKAVDTTAAGDTFTGYFFAAVCDGKTPAEALRVASHASALAVQRPGAACSIPLRAEVEALLR